MFQISLSLIYCLLCILILSLSWVVFKYKLLLNFGFRLILIILTSSWLITISIHRWLLRSSILILSILHLILFSILLIYIFTNLPTSIHWSCLWLNILPWRSFNTISLSVFNLPLKFNSRYLKIQYKNPMLFYSIYSF